MEMKTKPEGHQARRKTI